MITTNFARADIYSSRCQNENCVSFKKFKVPGKFFVNLFSDKNHHSKARIKNTCSLDQKLTVLYLLISKEVKPKLKKSCTRGNILHLNKDSKVLGHQCQGMLKNTDYRQLKYTYLYLENTLMSQQIMKSYFLEMNVCNFNYCHVNALCTPNDITGLTSLHASCACRAGFEGNGVNPTTGILVLTNSS